MTALTHVKTLAWHHALSLLLSLLLLLILPLSLAWVNELEDHDFAGHYVLQEMAMEVDAINESAYPWTADASLSRHPRDIARTPRKIPEGYTAVNASASVLATNPTARGGWNSEMGARSPSSHRCATDLYTCRGRCGAEPNAACSCHATCGFYENCCEDYHDVCSDATQASSSSPGGTVMCLNHNFLIVSCRSDMENSQVPATASYSVNEGSSWEEITLKNAAAQCIHGNSRRGTLMSSTPVSDLATGLHYRNVYCALCNNASRVEFWVGYLRCDDSTLKPAEKAGTISMEDTEYLFLTISPQESRCHLAWLPGVGSPNSCFSPDQLVHGLGGEDTSGLDRSAGEWVEGHGAGAAAAAADGGGDDEEEQPGDVFQLPRLRNTKGKANQPEVAMDVPKENVSSLATECARFHSYVEVPAASGQVYQNIYCAHLYSNVPAPERCEPFVPRMPAAGIGHWYTIRKRRPLVPGGDEFRVDDTITPQALTSLVDQKEVKGCEVGHHLVPLDGECHRVSFYLHLTLNFTFEHSVLIRGSFSNQVDKFVVFTLNTFTRDGISNNTRCGGATYQQSQVPGSSFKFTGHINVGCVELHPLSASVGETALTDGGVLTDDSLNRHISFILTNLRTIMNSRDSVTLPLTLHVYPCIIPVVEEASMKQGYCSEMKKVWKAVKKVDALIGSVSLEGFITILCCSLSDIGLLIRLALQNVVPFYKSYPGKVQFCLCLSLLFSYSFFLLGGMMEEASVSCMVVAVITHLSFLSALLWMNVTAFEIWRIFRHWRTQVMSRGRASLILSIIYAVGLPLLLVIAALCVEELAPLSELSPAYGNYYCWLNGTVAVAVYFVAPCSFICFMNAIFVGLTLRGLRRQRTSISEFKKSNAMTAISDTTIVVKIILLVGITWLLGLLAALVANQVVWIIFTVVNASLGFFVSAVLVLNKRVYHAVQRRCLCYSTDSIAVVSTQVSLLYWMAISHFDFLNSIMKISLKLKDAAPHTPTVI